VSAEQPLYVSRPTVRSVWQEYRLFADRLELDLHLVGTIRVPLEDLTKVTVRPKGGVAFEVLRGDYGLKDLLRTVKLDWADLNEHVSVERETGVFRQFRLTPEDPAEFVRQVEAARRARGSKR
jgi:hypothetical protein